MSRSTLRSPDATPVGPGRAAARLGRMLALERNVGLVAAAMFFMAFGEQLWRRFVPRYLEVLGAPPVAIGAYGSTQDLLDGLYQYPGGWLADRIGRRETLRICVVAAALGYAVYLVAPSWPAVFLGLLLAAAWSSMASPTLFAVIGDALPTRRRAMGFTVQAVLRRIPIAVAPTLGGLALAAYGVRDGIRFGLAVTLGMAGATLVVISSIRLTLPPPSQATGIAAVWRSVSHPLRRLLAADILIRTCEGMAGVFIVLYATHVVGVSAPQFGLLVAVEMTTAMAVYLPAARFADRLGRRPFVIATFIAFTAFPLAVTLARSFPELLAAFVIGGLREVGEPARKAMILDQADPGLRGRTVGLYYLIRSVAIAPAALLGGLLWIHSAAAPFVVAAGFGLAGTLLFALSREVADGT